MTKNANLEEGLTVKGTTPIDVLAKNFAGYNDLVEGKRDMIRHRLRQLDELASFLMGRKSSDQISKGIDPRPLPPGELQATLTKNAEFLDDVNDQLAYIIDTLTQ